MAACGEPQEVLQSGAIGGTGQAGDVLLRGVYVDPADSYRYLAGADPVVWLTLINDGKAVDTLTGVTTPYAAAVEIRWDRGCDGSAEVVPALPLKPADPAPNTSAGPAATILDPYYLRLVDLDREVLAGTTIPLTFSFDNAGAVTVDAVVLSEAGAVATPGGRC